MSVPHGQLPAATDLVVRNQPQRALNTARTAPYHVPARHTSPTTNIPGGMWSEDFATDTGPLSAGAAPSDTEGGRSWPAVGSGGASLSASSSLSSLDDPANGGSLFASQPSGDAGLAARYPLYTPPPAAQRGPTRLQGTSARSVAVDLERAVTRLHLEHRRAEFYGFQELGVNAKLDYVFLHLVKVEEMHSSLEAQCASLADRLTDIEKLCQVAWQPSKAQIKLVRSLTRHYLVKPLSSYNLLPAAVKSYIKEHPDKFRLELYLTDPTVRITMNMHITDLASQMKSTFRKAVFASCKNQVSLESFTRNMLDNYHLPAIPADLPLSILGTFAMMRKIAEPLSKKAEGSRGGDTGFWRAVKAELDRLYSLPEADKDRNNGPFWINWAKAQIEEDHARTANGRVGRRSRRANVASDDDVSMALGTDGQAPENLDSGLMNPGSPSANDIELPPLQEGEDMDDGEEPLSPLNTVGDVASTIPAS
ncbi:hypothetical protein FKP32DRAFT_1672527 [Trametes sanguinea]|nr:hypothetical protein FKP32DRAFT_1672527 [Trametes sanguinea]